MKSFLEAIALVGVIEIVWSITGHDPTIRSGIAVLLIGFVGLVILELRR